MPTSVFVWWFFLEWICLGKSMAFRQKCLGCGVFFWVYYLGRYVMYHWPTTGNVSLDHLLQMSPHFNADKLLFSLNYYPVGRHMWFFLSALYNTPVWDIYPASPYLLPQIFILLWTVVVELVNGNMKKMESEVQGYITVVSSLSSLPLWNASSSTEG